MRVAVVGSRDFPQLDQVWQFILKLAARDPETIIISGGARGVDTVAAVAARFAGLAVEEVLPDWDRHGSLAGLARNSQIVERADAVAAFWDGVSRGTKDTLDKTRAANKKLLVFLPR